MIDLELNDPDDTLGDVLARMPGDCQISIGIHGGYVYEGSVKGFPAAEEEIDGHHLLMNLKMFRKDLQEYRKAVLKGDAGEMETYRERMEKRLEYAGQYVNVRDRHIISAYARGLDDSILTMVLEGEERTNREPLRG